MKSLVSKFFNFGTIISFLICILPILNYYVIDGHYINSFIVMILFFLLIVYFLLKGYTVNKDKFYLFIFLIYFVFSTLIGHIVNIYSTDIGNIFLISVMLIIISLLFPEKSFSHHFIVVYSFICAVLLIYFVVQLLSFYLFNVMLSGKIPFLTLEDGYILDNHIFGISESAYYVSFSSLFSERAHLVIYCSPFICMNLCGIEGLFKKNIKLGLLLSLLLLFTFSGTAIVIIAFVWLFYFGLQKKIKLKTKIFAVIVVACIIVATFSVLYKIPSFNSIMNSLFIGEKSKSSYRIYRGFDIFTKIRVDKMIFGTGFKSLASYSSIYNIKSVFDVNNVSNTEYLNSISQLLIYFGFLGFIIYSLFYLKMLKRNNTLSRMILLVFFLLSISSSILFDGDWITIICLVLSIMGVECSNEEKIKFR